MDAPLPARAPASRWLTTAVLAAALCGLGDGLWTALLAAEPVPAEVLGPVLLAAVGLYTAAAVVFGLCQALLASSIEELVDLPRSLSWLRAQVRDEAVDRRLAAGLLSGFATLGLLAAAVYLFSRGFAVDMANKRNTALSTALFSAAAAPFVALGFFPWYRALRQAVRVLPRPRLLWSLGLCAALGLGLALLAFLSVEWRAISLGPAKALLAFLGLQALLLKARRSEALWQSQPRWLKGLVFCSLGLSVGLCSTFTFTRFGDDPRARSLAQQTAGAKVLLSASQRLADRDGDGYAAILGGGDCDDHDPRVHPGAEDVPGDGVDQDCEDGDEAPAKAAQDPPGEPPGAAPQRLAALAPAPAPAGPLPRWKGNWLIITIDTLREDRINQKTAPNLQALAARGTRFLNVYAQAPNTPRSFPSFLTSRVPSQVHFVRQSLNFSPVTGEDPTLFTALSGAGYRTLGIFSHFYMEQKMGLAKGFDEWRNDEAKTLHESNSEIPAPRITRRVVERLKALGREERDGRRRQAPFVLWTHLFDPHSTYMDHPEFPVAGKGMRYLGERYDAEVAFTDLHVGKMLAALKEAGLSDKTAVVVFSDHGEAFGEHKLGGEPLYFHGESLYDEVLRVPLLVYVPGQVPWRPQQIADQVMLIDLAPTVLELAGVPPPASFRGRSLLGRMSGQPLAPLSAYAEMLPCTSWQHSERALIQGDFKLYMRFTENTAELYNLREDPTEQRNLASRQPELVRAMKRQLGVVARGG